MKKNIKKDPVLDQLIQSLKDSCEAGRPDINLQKTISYLLKQQ